ncbi:acyl-CoA dehydrogenase family protein, partial [Acinetobacter baumannii]
VMEQVRTAGMVAACADGLGSVEAAIQLTSEYVRNRRQFGKPLADNQAVRHKIAEMLVGLESIKSMSLLAAIAYDEPDSAMAGD